MKIKILIILFFTPLFLIGQNKSKVDTTANEGLIVKSANSQFYDASGEKDKLYLRGNVRLTHDSIYMFCDTAVIVENDLWAKGNITIIKNDTVQIFADSLLYRGDSLMAYFIDNVVLEDGTHRLFTDYLQYDLDTDIASYQDTALLISNQVKLKSKRGLFYSGADYAEFFDNVTVEGKNFDLFSHSLRFFTTTQKVEFLSPTVINQEGKRIYTENGYYDLDDGNYKLFGNAQILDADKSYEADTIFKGVDTTLVVLDGNAKFKSETERGVANRIEFDEKTSDVTLMGNADYSSEANQASGDTIIYINKNGSTSIKGKGNYSDGDVQIIAEKLDQDKDRGISIAEGNVIWRDTSKNIEIVCDRAESVDSISFVKAFNKDNSKPIFKQFDDEDTMYVSADTLVNYSEGDSVNFFLGINRVEILNNEIQAICDSLVYGGPDSLLQLYKSPFMWTDSSQFNADSIIISMENESVKQMDLKGKALFIRTEDMLFFDQIGGDKMEIHFRDKAIHKMYTYGNGKSVFYMKDSEKAYVGVDETSCMNMRFDFENEDLIKTSYYEKPTSEMNPMDKVDHNQIKLSGFVWKYELRPIKWQDLMY